MIRRSIAVLLGFVVIGGCSPGSTGPSRYDPEAPEIPVESAALSGPDFRFVVGVDGDCVLYRVERAGLAATGGTVCRSKGAGGDAPPHGRVWVEGHSSTSAFLVIRYDGCVRSPAVQGVRASDSTVTTICDARVPSVTFGRLFDDVASGCLVNEWGGAHFVTPNADGVFLEEGNENAFALGFSAGGHLVGDPPVDEPFAPGLAACEAIGPWRGGG